MQARTPRIFGPARIVALLLVAVPVIALGYLRFAPDAGPVSVPSGAHAGQLVLKPCQYGTEHGHYAADCGTLVVRENRADAHSRLIALPVKRIRAHSLHPGAPIFRLEGGPGLSNMSFPDASRFADHHDVVLVGYRGVDGSSRLDCPEVTSALEHSSDLLGASSYSARIAAYRACASRLQAHGFDLAGYTLPERVDDLESARRALGYGRVDLLSESAGTRTAMIYSWRHPKSVGRSVMIGANPPGDFYWNTATIDRQIGHYSALCSKAATCRARTRDLAASIKWTNAHMPDRWWFLPIRKGNVRVASFFGLMNSTSASAPLSAPLTIDSWLAAGKGDSSGFWLQSVMAALVFPRAQVWGDVAATARADAASAGDAFAPATDRGSILGNPGTDFLWAGGRLRSAWPAAPGESEYSRVRTSSTETLVISGALDFATPAGNATEELLPHLPRGHQVVLRGLGHTDDFWGYEPEASAHLVNTFLDSGTVDSSRYTGHNVRFDDGFAQTRIAKIVLGSMLGFAALTLLSLLWMPRRVHRRGGFGRTASVALRVLYLPLLGLGGWFLGALIVLTAMPTVPLDNELLAGLSIGLPIGLGTYWASVQREWSAGAKVSGLAAALGGGLVGAWLGFQAVPGLPAVLTTIAGAAAGANLTVILLGAARDRAAAEQAVAPAVRQALATARPGPEM